MSKYLILILSLIIINMSTYSQGISVDLNGGVSIPTSKFKDSINTGFGGTLRIGYMLSNDLTITGKSGYLYFPGQTKTIEDGTMKTSIGVIPILFGVKYFPSFLNQVFSDEKMRFYGGAEVGVFLFRNKQSKNLTRLGNKEVINTANWPGFSPSFGLQYKFFDGLYIGYDFNYYYVGTEGIPTSWFGGEINFQYDFKF